MTATAPARRWGLVTILLHWLGAIVVIGLVALGWAMLRFFDSATRFDLYQLHKSFGVVALALLAFRLTARALTPSPSPSPIDGPAWERAAAHATHVGLYVLMGAVILAGWVSASSAPLPIPTVVFGLFTWPNIAPSNATLFAFASAAHAWLAYALAALIALHGLAALKHQFWDRDGLMRRMIPGVD